MTTHSHKRTHPYHYQTVFHSVGTSLQICPSAKMPPNKHRLTVNTTKPRQYWNGFRNKNRTDIIYLASVTDVKDTWILLHIRMHNLTALNKNKTINSQSRVDCNVFIWPSLTEFIVQYLLFGFMFYCFTTSKKLCHTYHLLYKITVRAGWPEEKPGHWVTLVTPFRWDRNEKVTTEILQNWEEKTKNRTRIRSEPS